jgi:hypothetical protein
MARGGPLPVPGRADVTVVQGVKAAGLVVRISCRPAQAVKEVSADRCRFQVAAAASSHRLITAE